MRFLLLFICLLLSTSVFAQGLGSSPFMQEYRRRADIEAKKQASAIKELEFSEEILSGCIMTGFGMGGAAECWMTIRQYAAMLRSVGGVVAWSGQVVEDDDSLFAFKVKILGRESFLIAFKLDYGEIFPVAVGDKDDYYLNNKESVERNIMQVIKFDLGVALERAYPAKRTGTQINSDPTPNRLEEAVLFAKNRNSARTYYQIYLNAYYCLNDKGTSFTSTELDMIGKTIEVRMKEINIIDDEKDKIWEQVVSDFNTNRAQMTPESCAADKQQASLLLPEAFASDGSQNR